MAIMAGKVIEYITALCILSSFFVFLQRVDCPVKRSSLAPVQCNMSTLFLELERFLFHFLLDKMFDPIEMLVAIADTKISGRWGTQLEQLHDTMGNA